MKKVFGDVEPEERARVQGTEMQLGRLTRELFLSDHIIGTDIENTGDEKLGQVDQLESLTM